MRNNLFAFVANMFASGAMELHIADGTIRFNINTNKLRK